MLWTILLIVIALALLPAAIEVAALLFMLALRALPYLICAVFALVLLIGGLGECSQP